MKITYTEPKNTVKFSDIAIGQTFIADKELYVRIVCEYHTDNVLCFTNNKTYRVSDSLSVKPVDVELIVHTEEP